MFNIGAAVLAGGASRRMGRDKAMLPWGESTFLEHILLQLRECSWQSGFFRETLICGGTERYAGFNLLLVPDAFAGCGPPFLILPWRNIWRVIWTNPLMR
jgi:molybdopterin-guanine dinucleotide biosynthesis protein A